MKQKIPVVLTVLIIVVLSCSPVSAKIHIEEELDIPDDQYAALLFVTTKDYVEVHLSAEEYGDSYYGLNVVIMNEINYELYIRGYTPSTYLSETVHDKGEFDTKLGVAGTYYLLVVNHHIRPSLEAYVKLTELTIGETIGLILGAISGVVVAITSFWIFYHFKNLRVSKKMETK